MNSQRILFRSRWFNASLWQIPRAVNQTDCVQGLAAGVIESQPFEWPSSFLSVLANNLLADLPEFFRGVRRVGAVNSLQQFGLQFRAVHFRIKRRMGFSQQTVQLRALGGRERLNGSLDFLHRAHGGKLASRNGANKPIHGSRHAAARGIPLLVKKFQANAKTRFPAERVERILALFEKAEWLERIAVDEFVE